MVFGFAAFKSRIWRAKQLIARDIKTAKPDTRFPQLCSMSPCLLQTLCPDWVDVKDNRLGYYFG